MPIGEIATSLKGAYVEVKWTIHSFFSLSVADGVYYYSPDFSIGGETWYLEIYANGRSGYGTRYYVDLGLWRDSCGPSIRQEFSFSLQSVKGKKENIKHCTKVFENKYPDNKCDFLRFIERSELLRRQNDLVPDGFLTIVYTVNNMTSARSASKSLYAACLQLVCACLHK